jgi:hypothetical protein
MSASSECGDSNASGRSVAAVAEKLHARVSGASALTLSVHLKASRHLVELRDLLLAGHTVSGRSATLLRCAGIDLCRRGSIDPAMEEDEHSCPSSAATATDAQARAQRASRLEYLHSSALIYLLLCIERASSFDGDMWSASSAASQLLDAHRKASLWDEMRQSGKPRDGASSAASADASAEGGAWAAALSPGRELADAALLVGASRLGEDLDDATVHALAALHFRASAVQLARRVLGLSEAGAEFVALQATPLTSRGVSRDDRLASIASSAESEAGQCVARDLLLSFLLPSELVGVRQTLLMGRDVSTAAGVHHADITNRAHSVAMAGTEFIWAHGTDELERAVCLLTGVAVLTTRGGADPVRKRDAFCGRVLLPFLETHAPTESALRLALDATSSTWTLFRISRSGAPSVVSSARGFDAMCDACIRLVDDVPRAHT